MVKKNSHGNDFSPSFHFFSQCSKTIESRFVYCTCVICVVFVFSRYLWLDQSVDIYGIYVNNDDAPLSWKPGHKEAEISISWFELIGLKMELDLAKIPWISLHLRLIDIWHLNQVSKSFPYFSAWLTGKNLKTDLRSYRRKN